MNKIQSVIDVLGEDLVIKHIIDGNYSMKVKLAMIVSNDNNGIISAYDVDEIGNQP